MKLHFKLLFLLLFQGCLISQLNAQWIQVGQDVNGEAADDRFGDCISISADGSIVAAGAYRNDGINGLDTFAGHVRVYENIAGTWTQIGQDIDGEAADDFFGHSVSLSSDGSIVASGGPLNDNNAINSGQVRVYKNTSGIWTQIGQSIYHDAFTGQLGKSVSLNSDGSIIAIGAPSADNGGEVVVYENIAGVWTQVGQDIEGENNSDQFGESVSLNADGSIFAAGANMNDGNGSNSGHVRVFENVSGTWVQIGQDIDGEAAEDYSGYSVSLNSNGNIVAIGAFLNDGNGNNSGHVRVFENIAGTWTQIGQDIDGESADDLAGVSVSLNSDGLVVAIGAYHNGDNGINSGHVRVFENISGTWIQIGQDIDGESIGGGAGYSVSLNSFGNILAQGACHNSDSAYDSGQIRVFENKTLSCEKRNANDYLSLYPNPTTGKFKIDLDDFDRLEILNNTGQVIVEAKENEIDIGDYPNGIYYIRIFRGEETITGEIIKK